MNSVDILSDPSVYWFLIGLSLATLEIVLPGMIVIFFGAAACVVSLICLIYPIGTSLELILFSIISILFLGLLRLRLKKAFFDSGKLPKDYLSDEFIGNRVTVAEPISSNKSGTVLFRGTQWKAISDETVAEGTEVYIIEKQNITLIVSTNKP